MVVSGDTPQIRLDSPRIGLVIRSCHPSQESGEFDPVGRARLAQHVRHVRRHGLLADHEGRRDLRIGEPVAEQIEDLVLPRRQLGQPWIVDQRSLRGCHQRDVHEPPEIRELSTDAFRAEPNGQFVPIAEKTDSLAAPGVTTAELRLGRPPARVHLEPGQLRVDETLTQIDPLGRLVDGADGSGSLRLVPALHRRQPDLSQRHPRSVPRQVFTRFEDDLGESGLQNSELGEQRASSLGGREPVAAGQGSGCQRHQPLGHVDGNARRGRGGQSHLVRLGGSVDFHEDGGPGRVEVEIRKVWTPDEQLPGPVDESDRVRRPASVGRESGERQPRTEIRDRPGIPDERPAEQVLASRTITQFEP